MDARQSFIDRLFGRIEAQGHAACVGLDPRLDLVPAELREQARATYGPGLQAAAMALLAFNRHVIDLIADLAVAVKPQAAFYERLGAHGFWAFQETCAYAADRGLLVIADVKRGDVGSTAEAYAEGYLGGCALEGETLTPLRADALTVNPYLGFDTLEPFVQAAQAHGKGVAVLVKTSNPGAGDLQDLLAEDRPLCHHVARAVARRGEELLGDCGFSSLGAVVGATYPAQARELRALMPRAWFLVPGYGAQGAGAADAFAGADRDRRGVLVNSARAVIHAYADPAVRARFGDCWRDAVRDAAERMANDLRV